MKNSKKSKLTSAQVYEINEVSQLTNLLKE